VEFRRRYASNPPHHDINPRTSEIFQVLVRMKNDGYSETTIESTGKRLRNLAKHVDLNNSQNIKEPIAEQEWSESYKENIVTPTVTMLKPLTYLGRNLVI